MKGISEEHPSGAPNEITENMEAASHKIKRWKCLMVLSMIARILHNSHLSIVTKLLILKGIKWSMLPETTARYENHSFCIFRNTELK